MRWQKLHILFSCLLNSKIYLIEGKKNASHLPKTKSPLPLMPKTYNCKIILFEIRKESSLANLHNHLKQKTCGLKSNKSSKLGPYVYW